MAETIIELPDGTEVKFEAATEKELETMLDDYFSSEFPDPTETK